MSTKKTPELKDLNKKNTKYIINVKKNSILEPRQSILTPVSSKGINKVFTFSNKFKSQSPKKKENENDTDDSFEDYSKGSKLTQTKSYLVQSKNFESILKNENGRESFSPRKLTKLEPIQNSPSPRKITKVINSGRRFTKKGSIEADQQQQVKQIGIQEQAMSNKFKFSALTYNGHYSEQQTKINQDAFFAKELTIDNENIYLFIVADGHGEQGHMVSQFVVKYLPDIITKRLKNKEINYEEIIESAFLQCQEKVERQAFAIKYSGSTVCLTLITGQKIICANLGDSRAMISRYLSFNRYAYESISNPHLPDQGEEKMRIQCYGGVVRKDTNQYGEEIEPFRVWEKEKDIPGLAMSRSIGDCKSKNLGIIAEPEILTINLDKNVHAIVLATDGIWEQLSQLEANLIIKPSVMGVQPENACEQLRLKAFNKWMKDKNQSDDITCIIAVRQNDNLKL